MSNLQNNATVLKSSSEIIISKNDSETGNSLSDLIDSVGSVNLVGSLSVSKDSLIASNNSLCPEIKRGVKQELLSNFSKFNIINKNLDYSIFSLEQISKNENWKNKVYKIRKINNDKNNFIRSIIFSYLENIILNNEYIILKEFIIKSNEIQDIKNKEKIIHILYIILDYLEKGGKIMDAYIIFLKAFFCVNEFDYDLNLLVRKLVYKYEAINQNKSLRVEQTKKLSKSLPEKYNKDNNGITQSLDNFHNDLINIDYEIPYNEIYCKIIPYIFKKNLNIIEVNSEKKKDNSEQIKEIKYKYNENNNNSLNLIYLKKDNSFNIYYSKDYYKKFENYFKLSNNKICKKCKKIYESEKYNYNMCDKCLLDEINPYLFIQYMGFRESNKNDIYDLTKSKRKKMIDYISKRPAQFSFIEGQNKPFGEIITQTNFDILDLIEKTKQRLCVVCKKDITKKNNKDIFSLPCKCNICSLKCLEEYFKSISEKNDYVLYNNEKVIRPMSECFCGYGYKLKVFNELKKLAEKINRKDFLDIIDKTIESNLIYKCALCRKNYDKTNKFLNLKLKDEKDHLFCENCAKEKKININEEKKNDNLIEFFCKFCESKHYIKSWEIAEESNCIVF